MPLSKAGEQIAIAIQLVNLVEDHQGWFAVGSDFFEDCVHRLYLILGLRMAGVEVSRAEGAFEADGKKYATGTFVIPMNQVFARYAKDLLEKQTYPEVRRGPNSPPEPPYDVTAWSLGMQMGVESVLGKKLSLDGTRFVKLTDSPKLAGEVNGAGTGIEFEYKGADTAIAINRLLKEGAYVGLKTEVGNGSPSTRIISLGVTRKRFETLARELNLSGTAVEVKPLLGHDGPLAKEPAGYPDRFKVATPTNPQQPSQLLRVHQSRVGLYQSWTGNMDEGWTRWVLEQYEFPYTTLHNSDIKSGKLREKFDVIVLPDQQPRDILTGYDFKTVREEYRGGIGDEGLDALRQFVRDGGTLIAMGASCDLMIDKFPIPVRNLKRGLTRDQHFAPGTIVRIQVDNMHALGLGMPSETYGFYNNSPFFALVEGFSSQKASVVARYPNSDVVASGWLKGEELMAGRAAVVSIEMNPGRIVLFGLRPQHRAQTHATFPLLFNSFYLAASVTVR